MEEWKEYRLGDVAIIKGGKRLPKGIELISNPNTHPYIRISDMYVNKTMELTSSYRYVDNNTFNKIKNYIVNSGDIILAIVGNTIGLVAVIGKSLNNANLTENCVKIIANKEVSQEYIYYYLTSIYGQNKIKKSIVGAAQPKLPIKNIISITISAPSKELQERTTNILSSLDDKIELNRRINENLEQQAQALFKSWFVDFEPFKDGKFVDSELGMIPEGWEVGQLLDFGKIICGKTPSKNIKEFFGGDIPFIKIPDMHNQLFIINTEDSLSVEGNQTQQTKLLPPYSLLVSCIATVGLVAINTRPSHTNQQINSIVPQNKNSLYYLYLNLTLMKKQLENMGRGGTATLNINTTSFGKTRMIIPNNEVLDKFSHIVEPLFKEIEILSKQTFELAQLRDILLPKLMSGELEINDFNN